MGIQDIENDSRSPEAGHFLVPAFDLKSDGKIEATRLKILPATPLETRQKSCNRKKSRVSEFDFGVEMISISLNSAESSIRI